MKCEWESLPYVLLYLITFELIAEIIWVIWTDENGTMYINNTTKTKFFRKCIKFKPSRHWLYSGVFINFEQISRIVDF